MYRKERHSRLERRIDSVLDSNVPGVVFVIFEVALHSLSSGRVFKNECELLFVLLLIKPLFKIMHFNSRGALSNSKSQSLTTDREGVKY